MIAELKNVFNTVQWAGVNSVVATDTAGNPAAALPTSGDELPRPAGTSRGSFSWGSR